MKINNQPFSSESNASQHVYFPLTCYSNSSFNSQPREVKSRGPDCSSIILNSATILAKGELPVESGRPGRALQRSADPSMLPMNSPWPWRPHQFCMRSPHQINWGLYCGAGSPGLPPGQTPTERRWWPHTHTVSANTQLRESNGILTAGSNWKQLIYKCCCHTTYKLGLQHEHKQNISILFSTH